MAFNCNDKQKLALLERLTSFGQPDEVYEIACDFSDKQDCETFVKRACLAGTTFSGEQLIELKYCLNEEFFKKLIFVNGKPLTHDLFLELDEDFSIYAAEKLGMESDSDKDPYNKRLPNEDEARFLLERLDYNKKSIDRIVSEGLEKGVIIETPESFVRPPSFDNPIPRSNNNKPSAMDKFLAASSSLTSSGDFKFAVVMIIGSIFALFKIMYDVGKGK